MNIVIFLVKTSQNPPPQSPLKSVKTLTYSDYFKGVRKVTMCDAHKPDKNFVGKMLTNLIQVNNCSPPNFRRQLTYGSNVQAWPLGPMFSMVLVF